MNLTVQDHEINSKLRSAVALAHMALVTDRSCPRPRVHVGQAVADHMRTLCITEDTRLPPGNRLAGFDVIVEDDWDPCRVVLRIDREIEA